MNRNYNELFEATKSRLNPENRVFDFEFRQELAGISYSDVLKFVRMAMKGVDPEYTAKTKEAGENVKSHLRAHLSNVEFEYQGSVMTNTHIKGHSDIDLLAISSKFYFYDAPRVNEIVNSQHERSKYYQHQLDRLIIESRGSSYGGDWNDDLWKLRMDSEGILTRVYQDCNTSKPKAIEVLNRGLKRKVDVVVANWYDDIRSIINDKAEYRGVQIYNKETKNREAPDYPLTSIKRINDRSADTNGRLKKMIRFLKNVKAASKVEIGLSSFDINAICFDIDISKYRNLVFYELVDVLYWQMRSIATNSQHSDDLVSVDGREYIFRYNSRKLENMKLLMNEVDLIRQDLVGIAVYG